MRNLLTLLSILTSLNLYSAIEGIQDQDWKENTEKVGQWYVEDEDEDLNVTDQKVDLDLDEAVGSSETEVNSPGGEEEAQQDDE